MNKGIFSVLSIRPFLFLLLAELFSQIAMNTLNFALIIAVYKLTESNSAVAGIIIAFTFPAILFGAVAGALVDRVNKRDVLLYTNVIRGLLIFLLAIFYHTLGMIYLLAFIIFTITQFFIPAETPIIPRLVEKKHLLAANALFGMGIYVSIFLAYALSSPSLIFLGEQKTYLFLGLLFLLAAVFIFFVKVNEDKPFRKAFKSLDIRSIFLDLSSTAKTIRESKDVMHALFLLTFFNVLILVIAAIGPGYAKQILNIPVESFPLLLVTPAAFGLIVGAIIVGNFFANRSRHKIANIGMYIIAGAALLLPFGSKVTAKPFILWINSFLPHYLDITIIHFMIVVVFILGIGSAFVFVPSNTLIQEQTTDALRGKIYGFLGTLSAVCSFLPIIAVGGLSDIFGVAYVLTGLGIGILLIAILRSTIL